MFSKSYVKCGFLTIKASFCSGAFLVIILHRIVDVFDKVQSAYQAISVGVHLCPLHAEMSEDSLHLFKITQDLIFEIYKSFLFLNCWNIPHAVLHLGQSFHTQSQCYYLLPLTSLHVVRCHQVFLRIPHLQTKYSLVKW